MAPIVECYCLAIVAAQRSRAERSIQRTVATILIILSGAVDIYEWPEEGRFMWTVNKLAPGCRYSGACMQDFE